MAAVRPLMLVKIVSIFLVVMVVLGMFGKLKLLLPWRTRVAQKCPDCGRHKIGKGHCPCGAKG